MRDGARTVTSSFSRASSSFSFASSSVSRSHASRIHTNASSARSPPSRRRRATADANARLGSRSSSTPSVPGGNACVATSMASRSHVAAARAAPGARAFVAHFAAARHVDANVERCASDTVRSERSEWIHSCAVRHIDRDASDPARRKASRASVAFATAAAFVEHPRSSRATATASTATASDACSRVAASTSVLDAAACWRGFLALSRRFAKSFTEATT